MTVANLRISNLQARQMLQRDQPGDEGAQGGLEHYEIFLSVEVEQWQRVTERLPRLNDDGTAAWPDTQEELNFPITGKIP